MVARLSQLQEAGKMDEEHASLAKAFCTVRMRETVGWARELMGGNGILLDYNIARFVADAEAIYSYEGTREINTLIGSNRVTIVPPGGTFTPKQLQLEPVGRKLYWCDREGMRVMRCDLDGSNVETLVQTGQ